MESNGNGVCPGCPANIELSIAAENVGNRDEKDKEARLCNIRTYMGYLAQRVQKSPEPCPDPQITSDGQLVCPFSRSLAIIDTLAIGPFPNRSKSNEPQAPVVDKPAANQREEVRHGTYL